MKSLISSFIRLCYMFLILGITSTTVFSQKDEEMIKQSIITLFDGMTAFDTTIIKSVISENVLMKSIAMNADGQSTVKQHVLKDFLHAIGSKNTGMTHDERLTDIDVKIDHHMAMVWTPYRFYLNHSFSHCGVNVFIMAKHQNKWIIEAITDTRRNFDCVP